MIDAARIFARALGAALPFTLLALGVQPAAAQYAPPTIVAPYEVAVALQRLGMRPTATPRSRGLYWIAPAMDRDGSGVTVVIEAETGDILDVSEIEQEPLRPRAPVGAAPYPFGPRYGMRDRDPYDGPRARNDPRRWSDAEDEAPISGPRVIPADPAVRPRGQIPAAPRVAARPAEQKPRTTPLPRPRPSELSAAVPQPAPAAKPNTWGPPVQGLE